MVSEALVGGVGYDREVSVAQDPEGTAGGGRGHGG